MTRAPDLQRRRRIRRMLYLARVVGVGPDHDTWAPRFPAPSLGGPGLHGAGFHAPIASTAGMAGAGLLGAHVRD